MPKTDDVRLHYEEAVASPLQLRRGHLSVETRGKGFIDLTGTVGDWLKGAEAKEGLLTLFVRHTSASLAVQENTDPDVLADLLDVLERLAPQGASYRHSLEGPDDMPAHVKAMLTTTSLSVPVVGGRLGIGTWQAIYLIEHRRAPHLRDISLIFLGI